jgi:hypothetical protein
MLNQLLQLVQQHGQEMVVNNPVIPNAKNNQVLADATQTVAEGLQTAVGSGGIDQITSLFQGQGGLSGIMQHPLVGNLVAQFQDKLSNQHGIAGGDASQIAGNLIPNVLQQFVQKTNDPNDSSLDFNSILQSLQSGGGFDLQGIIGKLGGAGLDANGDGQVGLDDVVQKFTGANGGKEGSGGGLMDTVKGFFN